MKVSTTEFALVALTIGYIAFYTNPPPKIIQDFISSPAGKIGSLVGIALIIVHKSLIVGIFLAIAGVVTIGNITEYLDPKEQKSPAPEQPKSAGVAAPEMQGALKSLLSGNPSAKKGDRMPSVAQKKGTPPLHSTPPAAPPKATPPKTVETFAPF